MRTFLSFLLILSAIHFTNAASFDCTKASASTKYALIIYHGCLGPIYRGCQSRIMYDWNGTLNTACIYNKDYYCPIPRIVNGTALESLKIYKNTSFPFYIIQGEIKKQISPLSIISFRHDTLGYNSYNSLCHPVGDRIMITANINGKEYDGELQIGMSDGCFLIQRAKIVVEEVFGEKHYLFRDFETIQQWPYEPSVSTPPCIADTKPDSTTENAEQIQPSGSQDGDATALFVALPDADVYMDGKYIGKTNTELKVVSGIHTMRFVKGDRKFNQQMTFKPGQNPATLISIP